MCFKHNNTSLNRVNDMLGHSLRIGDLIVVTTTGRNHQTQTQLAVITDPQRAMVRKFAKSGTDASLNVLYKLDVPRKLRSGFSRSVHVSLSQIHNDNLRRAAMELAGSGFMVTRSA